MGNSNFEQHLVLSISLVSKNSQYPKRNEFVWQVKLLKERHSNKKHKFLHSYNSLNNFLCLSFSSD